jgi:predicted RND superfamily exporter protein
VERLALSVTAWPRTTLTLAVLVLVLSGVAASGVQINSYLMEVFDDDDPQVVTMRQVERDLGGFMPVELEISVDEPGAFREPRFFRRVHALSKYAAQQDGVLLTRSYVDFHQELRAQMLGDPAQRAVLPADNAVGRAQIFQIQELIGDGRELGFDSYMAGKFNRTRILLRVSDIGSRRVLAMTDLLRAEAEKIFAGTGAQVRIAGEAYTASYGIDVFITDLAYSLVAAVLVIFVLMGAVFRSVRLGLISVLPNLGPLVLTAGYIGLRGYSLNVTNVVIFAIGLGLAVNDTIHFLTRFLEELAVHGELRTAILRAYRGAGRAIVLTTILLITGLAVLLTSDFVPSQRFAELVTVTLLGAIVGDLLLLPAMLMLFWKKEDAHGTS